MLAPRRTRMALVLLLALLAQPGWAVAHVAIHEHLTHGPHHLGGSDGHDHAPGPATGQEKHDHGHGQPGAPEAPLDDGDSFASNAGHDHDHHHLEATFVRRAGSMDEPSFAAIAAAGPPRIEPPVGRRRACADGRPSRSSPAHAAPSQPRAPPHA